MGELKRCNFGVGCEESGVCYAAAHGEPERCGRRPSWDDYARLLERVAVLEREHAAAQAELTRLRAVEKAARKYCAERGWSGSREKLIDTLAEAIGANSAVDRDCDRGRKG